MNASTRPAHEEARGFRLSWNRAGARVFAIALCWMVTSGPGFTYAASYSTGFSLQENPICEAGRWANGGTDGQDWADVAASSGRAFGTLSTVGYSDPTAILTGTWSPDQTVEATVFCVNPTIDYNQEVELRLRSAITPSVSTGYEVFFRCLKTDAGYAQIVRWNGTLGDFTSLALQSGADYGVADGDVVKATIAGNVIKGFINGVEVVSATDDSFTGGNPGMGFNYGVGDTHTDFGFTHWSATDSTGSPAWAASSLPSGCAAAAVETTCLFADHQSLAWEPVGGATRYSVYRGDLASLTDSNGDRLPDGGYGACQDSRDPDPTDTTFVDADLPAPAGFFYLVAYVSGGIETGLGATSYGTSRTAASSCP
jgi:hypothetical protein